MNLIPLYDRVIVEKKNEAGEVGGIIIPKTIKKDERILEGKVLAIGFGDINEDGSYKKMNIKIGDTIAFPFWAKSDMEYKGESYMILQEKDVYAIIREK